MEAFYPVVNISLLLSALTLPHFLGVLVLLRTRRYPKLAPFVGFLITTISSFFLLKLLIVKPATAADENMCGMGFLADMVLLLMLTFIQSAISFATQIYIYSKRAL
jgi:hypothetical protein